MTTNMTRYMTIVATVAVPNDDDIWDQIVADRVAALLDKLGLKIVPCDWAPDPDTIADAVGADYGTVSVLDLNPSRSTETSTPANERPAGAVIIEARCGDCGEYYNPEFPNDDHFIRDDGVTECGGPSTNAHWWGPSIGWQSAVRN